MTQGTPADLLLTPFGKYTLLSRLSSGGMAELFLAVQNFSLGFQRLVVVKRILAARKHDPAYIDMFRREARIAGTLSHPNVVQTFDASEIDGTYFIVMEYVHGEDLRSVLRAVKQQGQNAPPMEHVLHVALGVCAGLIHVHEKRDLEGRPLGIVHGDVSTHNVILGFAGDVKIVDFGIATSDWGDPPGPDSHRIRGKPRYMSPEQAAGEALDARADIFSLGVVLFELSTGQRLAHRLGRSGGADDATGAALVRPSDLVSGYPPALEAIVTRALQSSRADRYPSVRALLSDLEGFVRKERITPSPLLASAWIRSMFEEKIARQLELWGGLNDLVTTVGVPQELVPVEAPLPKPPPVPGSSLAPHSVPAPRPSRVRFGTTLVPLLSIAAAAGGVFYVRHQMTIRLMAAERKYRELAAPALAPPSAPQPAATGRVQVATRPGDGVIWVDGDRRSETTPAKLDSLPLGRELHLMVTKDGFEPYRAVVTLSAESPFQEIEADLKPLAATLLVQFVPQGSVEIWLDGKRWTGSRTKIDGLSADEHSVGVAASGFVPRAYKVSLKAGETKALNVVLPKLP